MLFEHERSIKRYSTIICILAILCSLVSQPNFAQTTSGTLIGQVLFEDGKPAPNVRITITNELNLNKRATLTDDAGTYEVPFLPPGLYTITASINGYIDGAVNGFRIPLNTTSPLRPPDITLKKIGSGNPNPTPTATTNQVERPELDGLITTSDPTRRGNFNERQLLALPLGGGTDMRTFDELALLLPGVAPPPFTPGVRGPGVGFGIGTAGQFSVNGQRARSNNFTIDGSDNNDPDVGIRRQGFVALAPQSIESTQEYQVSTLLSNSEFGRNAGGQVNAVSKGGGTAVHGQIYSFGTDSRLRARNPFDFIGGDSAGENPYSRVQTGFVVGGPIGNRTQFFAGFEYQGINAATEQHFATPTRAERNFEFQQDVNGSLTFGVLKPSTLFPANVFFGTTQGTTPLGRNVLTFYPLPNNPAGPYGANTYSQVLPASGHGTVSSFKLTHEISARNSLGGRYDFTNDNRILPSVNEAINSTIGSHTRTHNLALILDTALTPSLFNQARFSYGRTAFAASEFSGSPFTFSSKSSEPVIGLPDPVASETGPIGELLIEPFSPVGVDVFTFPQTRSSNTFQYADTLSYRVKRHSLKFGADIRRIDFNSRQDRNYRSEVIYGNGRVATGDLVFTNDINNPFAFQATPGTTQFLSGVQLATIGLPSSIVQTIANGAPDSTVDLRFTERDIFFNDNWRVRSNFSIDYGIRYENNSVPSEANNKIKNAITLANLPAPGGSTADTTGRTAAFNASVAAYKQVLNGRSQIYDSDHNNFGPHLGFAWDPFHTGKMALRGGYGIYYDTILGSVVTQSRNVFPNEVPINVDPAFLGFDVFSLNNPGSLIIQDGKDGRIAPISLIKPGGGNQFGGSSGDFVALLGQLFQQNRLGGGLAFTLPERKLRTPYTQQWHLTIESRVFNDYLLSFAYVGTKGTKLTRMVTPNLGPNTTPFIPVALTLEGQPALPFPLVVSAATTSGQPNRPTPELGAYQLFRDSANSNYNALQIEVRKRYSHGLTITGSYAWSHAIDDVSDLFPIAGASVLPQNSFNLKNERADASFDIRHRFASSVIWDLPFFLDSTDRRSRLLGGWQIASIVQANSGQPLTLTVPVDANFDGNLTDRPSTLTGIIFNSGHTAQKLTLAPGTKVTDFFTFGQDGAIGRNTVRGDGFMGVDLAINKSFKFNERRQLNIRTEMFNLFNRANYGLPNRIIGNPGFGSATETVAPMRTVQFAIKYSF